MSQLAGGESRILPAIAYQLLIRSNWWNRIPKSIQIRVPKENFIGYPFDEFTHIAFKWPCESEPIKSLIEFLEEGGIPFQLKLDYISSNDFPALVITAPKV